MHMGFQFSPCTFFVQDMINPVQSIFDGVLYSSLHFLCSQSKGFYLLFIRTGRGVLHRQNSDASLYPGMLVFMDRTMETSIEVIHPPFSVSCFILNSSDAGIAYAAYSADENPLFEVSAFSKIPGLIARLLCLSSDSSAGGQVLYELVSRDLLEELSICKSSGYGNHILPPLYIMSMKQILDTRYSESITLDTISSDLHINKYKLAKEFKTYCRVSPIEYLIEKRIQVACELLTSTQKTITQIGIDVSMENTSYFVRLFKRYKGIPPLQYRKKNQTTYSL